MRTENPLYQRRRSPTASELQAIPWLQALTSEERERAAADIRIALAEVGETVCRSGRPVTYWFGVVDGLLKMSIDNAQGQTTTLIGIPPGG